MSQLLKRLAALTANRAGLLNSYAFLRRKLTGSQVAILMYHRVCPAGDGWSPAPCSPRQFERQMEHICRDYELLSLDQLASYIHRGKTLPRKAMAVTLDDGYRDNYLYAYPVLEKHRIPATVFLATGYIGKDRLFWYDEVRYLIDNSPVAELHLDGLGTFSLQTGAARRHFGRIVSEKLKGLPDDRKNGLIAELTGVCRVRIPPGLGKDLVLSWDEVREMSNAGISFGAHTVNHPILPNLPLEQAMWEVVQSKKDIEDELGREVTTFAYPNGDFSPELVKLAKQSGFNCAVTAGVSRLVTPEDNAYELPRIGADEGFHKLMVVVSGLWEDLPSCLFGRPTRLWKEART